MAQAKLKILAIDDEDSMLRTYRSILKDSYVPLLAENAAKAFELLNTNDVSLVLLDMKMPGMSGIEVLKKVKELDKSIEIIVITAVPEVKTAVEALKLGAYDYMAKPFEVDELLALVEKALEKRALVKENRLLKQELEEKSPASDLIGKTGTMKKIIDFISRIAPTDSSVLITGESGTGKEIVARAIHKKSGRANRPFVVINCAAIPENLIESELFGCERGAYTGAFETREGKFELADGGTVFLDEIGCMKPAMQSKLLRVLQDSFIERVGSKKPIQVDVRVVSATNIDIDDSIKKGEFRQDLYYRLNIMRIHMPPLRDRREDVQLFLNYFVDKFNKKFNKNIKGFDKKSQAVLEHYDWPGNVRELQNLTERYVALCDKDEISIEDSAFDRSATSPTDKNFNDAVRNFERNLIRNAVTNSGGNQTKAAESLGIHRTTLIEKMKALDIK